MGERPENRVERIVNALLKGKRLKLRGADAEEKEAIIMAARLAAARQGQQRMSSTFRQQLARRLEAAPEQGWMTRRAALVAGLGVAAGSLGGLLAGRDLAGPAVVTADGGKTIVPDNGQWMDVGALADFPHGAAQQVKAGAVNAYVTRVGDKLVGVSAICSDLSCELWFDDARSALACPCHNRTFSVHGESNDTSYPHKLPALDVVQVRVTDAGRVEVMGV